MSDRVETEITPPSTGADDDGSENSSRLSVSLIDINDVHYDAAVQFFNDGATDPERFADALLNAALALAFMRGSDYSWAVMQRFANYDGLGR